MEILKQLLGRLHPVIVHLPIGFILLGILLQWSDRKRKDFGRVIPLIFLWGGISAVLACITGYLQYLGEGYTFETVKTHLWFGIITAIFAFVVYLKLTGLLKVNFIRESPVVIFSLVLLFLISLTGHLGGSITHGEDYLVEPLPNGVKSALGFEVYEEKPIALNEENWQEAVLYEDVIAPILNNKCVSCHNKKREKGELLLNSREGILKGGENGEVISTGNPEESPLFARLVLPEHHEDHMPPKDKTQPTKEEIAVIRAWIAHGTPFERSVRELGLQKTMFESFFPKKKNEDYPDIEIAAASMDSIKAIKQQGIHVQHISKSSNFLSVSCTNKPDFKDGDFQKLIPIGDQIASMDLGSTQVTDAIFKKLATLRHLTVLKIDNTEITGHQIDQLENLEYLRILNMTGTKFKKEYLEQLGKFKRLRAVYLFDTGLIAAENPRSLKNDTVKIEYGSFELPALKSDSIIY